MTTSAGLQGDAIPAAVERIRRLHRLLNSLNNWPNTFGTLTYHQRWAEFEKNACLPNADLLLLQRRSCNRFSSGTRLLWRLLR